MVTAVRALALCLAGLALLPTAVAQGAFPYRPGPDPTRYRDLRLPSGANQTPNDLQGKLEWMYAATAGTDGAPFAADARELNGVRGAHLADAADVDQAWRTTTGRPDVTIAVLDSGIEWNNDEAMADVRFKTRISRAETPAPRHDRASSTEPGVDCATYTAAGRRDERDLDGNGVFNLRDFACDSRVRPDPIDGVNQDLLDPQDLLIAFSDGKDDDGNGYPDDIVGWDFLDDDNDPFDDVQYGHGTGEARDSSAEADNGGGLGTCPNCTVTYLRVGTSFIADVNRFALATLYAADNGVDVVQEALGTLNKSALAGRAIDYAWEHGVTVVASAADEAAQHNNWPSSFPRVILVNSVTRTDEARSSYLQFNGCTNFNAKIDLAIPSVSCSSDATGRAAGMAGLVYAAALNAVEEGRLDPHPSCRRTDGSPCPVSAGEVKQLMASGILAGTPVADDVDFAQTATGLGSGELRCPAPGCTDPFLSAPPSRLGTPPASYPARRGHDQFYGYGRVNMDRVVDALAPAGGGSARIPPEVEVTGPAWYEQVDPRAASFDVRGRVWARGRAFTCQVLVAPGGYPGEDDFKPIGRATACDGATERSAPLDGTLATVPTAELRSLYPPGEPPSFDGPEDGAGPDQKYSGRPNDDPYGFVVKVVATLAGPDALAGQDRRKLFLHRDAQELDGFAKQLAGDGEASPVLADLDGDNRNELVVANSDGVVHAWRRDGSELPGWPVRTELLPRQDGRAFRTGGVERAAGAVIATPAVGDLDRDGTPEVVVADMEGTVSVFAADGRLVRRLRTDPAYSGRPRTPFVNDRKGKLNRTQLGFIASPVLADLDRNDGGRLEIVAAALDRHVYAWEDNGKAVPGWPVLVVDRAKVAAIDPTTHQVTFRDGAGADFDQGALVDTPAVADLDRRPDGTSPDPRPEVVVGSNESYAAAADGGLNAAGTDEASYGALGATLTLANGRLFAIRASGEPGDGLLGGASPFRDGWPFKVGILQAGVLPLVGEGITGSPVVATARCSADDAAGPRVGTIPAAGVAYLVRPDGRSCLGRSGDRDRALPSSGGRSADQPFLAAFGHPAFGALSGSEPTFLAPAAGVTRAVDVVLPEYQGGRDQLVAWDPSSGAVRPGWPADVNDLQFLTGPSIADIDPSTPGEEVVAGTASMDLQGLTASGADVAGWPKLTGDWTVANPAIGSFGTLDTEAGSKKVVISLTRAGRVAAYATQAPGCAPASWPQFHHDRANSGDADRDAIPPGTPTGVSVSGATLRLTVPGDDLLCGRAKALQVVTGSQPVTGRTFDAATPVAVSATPGEPGTAQTLTLPSGLDRYLAVRAVDDQGNVGPAVALDRGRARRCLPARVRLARTGVRRLRLGAPLPSLLRALGARRAARTRVVACVTGGGRAVAVLRRSRTVLVLSTARGHRLRGVHAGMRLRSARRRLPGLRRVAPGLYATRGTVRSVVRMRRGRVAALGVASRRAWRSGRTLRRVVLRALR